MTLRVLSFEALSDQLTGASGGFGDFYSSPLGLLMGSMAMYYSCLAILAWGLGAGGGGGGGLF